MSSIRDQMEQARALIQQKRYPEARAILTTIDHPKAKEWLIKLARLEAVEDVGLPKLSVPTRTTPYPLCEVCNVHEGESHSYRYGHHDYEDDSEGNRTVFFVEDGIGSIVVCKHCAKKRAKREAKNEMVIGITIGILLAIWLAPYGLRNPGTVVICFGALAIVAGVLGHIAPDENDGVRALIKEKAKREGQALPD